MARKPKAEPSKTGPKAETRGEDDRRYHHGDLQRALVDAGRRVLEREGLPAMSLRAVAREAGVSAAAPYHHFEDRAALLYAVGCEGSLILAERLREASEAHPPGRARMVAVGVAYVEFGLDNPHLYQLMMDTTRLRDTLPRENDPEAAVPRIVASAFAGIFPENSSETDRRLRGVVGFSVLRGLVEIAAFRFSQPLMTSLGGRRAFLEAVLSRLTLDGDAEAG
jgi:AcrR family transcriptional regulator